MGRLKHEGESIHWFGRVKAPKKDREAEKAEKNRQRAIDSLHAQLKRYPRGSKEWRDIIKQLRRLTLCRKARAGDRSLKCPESIEKKESAGKPGV